MGAETAQDGGIGFLASGGEVTKADVDVPMRYAQLPSTLLLSGAGNKNIRTSTRTETWQRALRYASVVPAGTTFPVPSRHHREAHRRRVIGQVGIRRIRIHHSEAARTEQCGTAAAISSHYMCRLVAQLLSLRLSCRAPPDAA
ncbi:MAG: hypothetical protein WA869_15570 [Alloacidobacterium sp.]